LSGKKENAAQRGTESSVSEELIELRQETLVDKVGDCLKPADDLQAHRGSLIENRGIPVPMHSLNAISDDFKRPNSAST
jgi:hypothetical protein